MSRSRRWGVLLDRDGTLVPDAGHPVRPAQLVLYRRAGAAAAALASAGARLAVISNQSAVARGLLDRRGLAALDRRLRDLLRPFGVRLAGTHYCPHHPDFTGPCPCRKPAPGLVREALQRLRLEPGDVYLVGDTAADMQAGRSAGVRRTILVLTGHGRRHRHEVEERGLAVHVARDLESAARWILEDRRPRGKD